MDVHAESQRDNDTYSTLVNRSRKLLHPHWQAFDEPPYVYHQTVGGIMCLILVLALTGNALTIIIILRYPSLRTVSNILVINLALSDLLMALTGFPLYIVASFKGYWPFSPEVCEFYGFAGGAFGLLSINTLAAIAIERYGVIVRPLFKQRQKKVKHSLCMVAGVWIYSLGWAFPPLAGWNRYTWEGYGTSCSFDYLTKSLGYTSFVWSMFVAGFIVPLFCIIYCYMYILTKVFHQKREFLLYSKQLQARVIRGSRQYKQAFEVKTALTTLWCILLFCLSWTPYAVVALLGEHTDGSMITPLASVLPGLFAKASTIYNPIIYALSHPRIKAKLKLLLTCGSKTIKKNTMRSLTVCGSSNCSNRHINKTAVTTFIYNTGKGTPLGEHNSSFRRSVHFEMESYNNISHLSNNNSECEVEKNDPSIVSTDSECDDVKKWNLIPTTEDKLDQKDDQTPNGKQYFKDSKKLHCQIVPRSQSQPEFFKPASCSSAHHTTNKPSLFVSMGGHSLSKRASNSIPYISCRNSIPPEQNQHFDLSPSARTSPSCPMTGQRLL